MSSEMAFKIKVQVRGTQKTYVPAHRRRSLFWLIHKTLHLGSTKLLEIFRAHNLFWPLMQSDAERFLSQCSCANKKSNSPHQYSEHVPIIAKHPLHILGIDLYGYGDGLYFTTMDIFAKFSWVLRVENKQAPTILKAYQEYISKFAEPVWISCDNGTEFNLITTQKTSHSSEHSQSNGIIERYHLELGKLSRIFETTLDMIHERLNTEQSKFLFYSHLKVLHHSPINCVMTYSTRKFHYNELVWRLIPKE